ncbi:MAG: insulinase family protein [Gammaproteobacteria bacterium]|nr:insulinase family protein [Gammaproteobacteria bacterium]NIR97395.1 insulinase family protein [Gammaproteobacteria bacterium]NIT63048.1 insulinase family protein [Gammaproteobacteria bacterium]NIV20010.1 insulinase family protein [Gammaproteobacteria bacterium]NIX10086.1 insulinase family protein [Gammaproteobacteria bacterium]
MLQRTLIGLAALVALPAGAAPVHEFTLDNGLKLLVREDHRAPVVVSQVWYKVGSSYEHNGITGISHVLEHMMFKGTEKHAPGEFSRIIAANGGRENAFTGRDYTAYFQQLEESRLEVSFRLEADRMRNLLLPKDELAKEVQVVMEERRLRTEDDPQSITYERFNAAAFVTSPYRNPVIGWMQDLEQLRLEDLQHWYRRWYAPNNATVVVVGNVDPDEVLALARKHFGPLSAEAVQPPRRVVEVPQRGVRRIVVQAQARLPYLVMGYKAPVLTTAEREWEPYALEVLAGILDGGDSARLPSEVVRAGVAARAGAGYDANARLETLFLLDATPANGQGLDAVEQALNQQIRRLKQEPVGEQELARVKAQVVADDVYQRDSVFYQAMQIGMLETVGLGWQRGEEYVERIRAVTAEQVQEVAKKYLQEDRLTVAVLDPQPMGAGETPEAGGKGAHRVH